MVPRALIQWLLPGSRQIASLQRISTYLLRTGDRSNGRV